MMADFDMDMHVKKVQLDKPMFAVVIKKRTAKSEDRYFIIVKKGECFLPTAFHGIGFWATEIPKLDMEITASQQFLDSQAYEEVWIPYENIDYVKSLVYTKR
jgi:hypothetical protein